MCSSTVDRCWGASGLDGLFLGSHLANILIVIVDKPPDGLSTPPLAQVQCLLCAAYTILGLEQVCPGLFGRIGVLCPWYPVYAGGDDLHKSIDHLTFVCDLNLELTK